MKKPLIVSTMLLFAIALAGCQQKAPTTPAGQPGSSTTGTTTGASGKLYTLDMKNCAGFSTQDAATILGTSAANITPEISSLYEGFWMCSYGAPNDYTNFISFSVGISKSAEEAADYMEQLQNNLGIAKEVIPGEDQSTGPYMMIPGIGDEAFWTDVNGTLNARKGNITLQVILPDDVEKQKEVAKKIFSKF